MNKMALALVGAVSMVVSGSAMAQSSYSDSAFLEQLRSAIRAHPELIVDTLNDFQNKKQQESQAALNQTALATRPALIAQDTPGVVIGNPNGTRTLVEFLDYRCHYCQQMHAGVEGLISTNKDLRVVIMMRPILGPDSEVLARYALAANLQGKFKAVHDELYRVQYKVDEAGLTELSKKTGVDYAKAKAAMTSPAVGDRLAKNVSFAEQLKINGTPYFITQTAVIPGATDVANLLH